MKKYLEEDTGIEVIKPISGSTKAKEQIIKIKPDLLFPDIEMPGMNGLDFQLYPQDTNTHDFRHGF